MRPRHYMNEKVKLNTKRNLVTFRFILRASGQIYKLEFVT
jgi:hypothetical protein